MKNANVQNANVQNADFFFLVLPVHFILFLKLPDYVRKNCFITVAFHINIIVVCRYFHFHNGILSPKNAYNIGGGMNQLNLHLGGVTCITRS